MLQRKFQFHKLMWIFVFVVGSRIPVINSTQVSTQFVERKKEWEREREKINRKNLVSLSPFWAESF